MEDPIWIPRQICYQSLGVNRDASKTDIKKAFRKLTQQFHPDKNPGDAKAEERFKEVSTAYEVLGDEDKRKSSFKTLRDIDGI